MTDAPLLPPIMPKIAPDQGDDETDAGYAYRTAKIGDVLPPNTGGGGNGEDNGEYTFVGGPIAMWGCVVFLILLCIAAFAWVVWQWVCCGLTL